MEVDTKVAKMCFDGATSCCTSSTASAKASQSIFVIRHDGQSPGGRVRPWGAPSRHPNLEGLHIIQVGWGAHEGRRSGPITEHRISYKRCFEICGHLLTFCKHLVLWII